MSTFQENVKHMIRRSAGSTFWRKITVTSSKIKTATKLAISQAATGDLVITQIIGKTDSTGLAGGTNFQLGSTNAKGVANIVALTVAELGANQAFVLSPGVTDADMSTSDPTPSITAWVTVLEAGANLWLQNSVADGTGAGTIDLYIKFERVTENADVNMVGTTI